ncbi:hypothetical protein M413DRAFT_440605 [Hebeloma cylindrosporum]|uniref:Granulins domain-containing protein n=1 Tax=Hebeloma cylindrosporum TaxID=76867 RepID=A0A0C3CE48_HEBCY|nr:hypothetical protein M413DRAFT_440605 [Hebeloma cylindrosporum h7]
MFKLAIYLAFAAFASEAVHAQTIPVGELCSGIAGPLPTPCAAGSVCCPVGPDRSLCAAVYTCPSQFVPIGGTCSGIGGPSPYPCFPGTTCCNISPDNSQCKATC